MSDCSRLSKDQVWTFTFLLEQGTLPHVEFKNSDERDIFLDALSYLEWRLRYDEDDRICLDRLVSELDNKLQGISPFQHDQILGQASWILRRSTEESGFGFNREELPSLLRWTDSDGSLGFATFVSYLYGLSPADQEAALAGLTERQREEFFRGLQEAGMAFGGEEFVANVFAQLNAQNFDFKEFVDEFVVELLGYSPQLRFAALSQLIGISPRVANLVLQAVDPNVMGTQVHEDLGRIVGWIRPDGSFASDDFLSFLVGLPFDEQQQFLSLFEGLESHFNNEDLLTTKLVDYVVGDGLRSLLLDEDKEGVLAFIRQLDDLTRVRLGLPTEADLFEETLDITQERPVIYHFELASDFLNSWDPLLEKFWFRLFQRAIDEIPQTVLEISTDGVKSAYQQYYQVMHQRHETFEDLREQIKEFDRQGRCIIIDSIRKMAEQSKSARVYLLTYFNWEDRPLHDGPHGLGLMSLVSEVESRWITDYQGENSDANLFYNDLYYNLWGLPPERGAFDKLFANPVFQMVASILWEPLDYVITGFSIAYNIRDKEYLSAAINVLGFLPGISGASTNKFMDEALEAGRYGDDVLDAGRYGDDVLDLGPEIRLREKGDFTRPSFKTLEERYQYDFERSNPQEFIDEFIADLRGAKPSVSVKYYPDYDTNFGPAGSAITAEGDELIRIGAGVRRDSQLFVTIFHEEMHVRLAMRVRAGDLRAAEIIDREIVIIHDDLTEEIISFEEIYVEQVAQRYYD